MKIKTKLTAMILTVFVLPLLTLVNLPHKVFGKVEIVPKKAVDAYEAHCNCGNTIGERCSSK